MMRLLAGSAVLLALAGCASQVPAAVEPQAPGFLLGLVHGIIAPFTWLISLFRSDVAIYAVPNNGGWYDFGFMLGIGALGGGASAGAKRR